MRLVSVKYYEHSRFSLDLLAALALIRVTSHEEKKRFDRINRMSDET